MADALAVRDARSAEVRAIARTLARAFADDPVQRFLFPSDRAYETRGTANFALLVRRVLAVGVAEVTDGLEGAALWMPPRADFLDGAGGYVFAARSAWLVRANLGNARALLGALAKHHPHEPHWYLPVLGTDPAHQGRGAGSALLTRALARSDAAGLPAYLESSKERNLPFYQRHGFEVVGHIRIPNGPELWPMLRKPRL
jgi:ribosomal protein S18 acetylase RimI-like enzyme